ncbi:2-phospho-L-lactate guanylyltransferase [Marinitenerispora sediminis]|uniref:2-phospho-L-lactate guanylyltransferase n=1 Tax=Marinitenerispora sediminis TaxID=1931232 RepID=UPI0015F14521|nr:2-phospho-L-lactate guanylyltransferase [Marinitenerispora sediminis]
MTGVEDDQRWSLVIPVKRLTAAKSRLAPSVGRHRAELALAVASDTVMAAVECPRVIEVIVVTDDPLAAGALADLGARPVADEPDAGLNPALRHGAAVAAGLHPGSGVCALSADLPALRPAELDRVLAAAARHEHAFLADAPGVGTTLYAAASGGEFRPAFEGRSRERHRAGGAAEIDLVDVPGARRDVDTLSDLREAARLGVGPHTAKLLARLSL